MQRSNRRRLFLAATAAVVAQFGIASHSDAVSKTWDGGGTNDFLSTPENWDANTLPAIGDSIFFAGSTRLTPAASADAQYLALFFAAGASPFDVQGPGAITLGSTTGGQYLNNDTAGVTQTISAPINMIGGNINATQGSLLLSGPINFGNSGTAAGNGVTLQGANNITLTGLLTSSYNAATASLTKAGTGNLVITGSNPNLNGRVFINGGNVRISNATSLGSDVGHIETALTSGGSGLGTLELDAATGSTPAGFTLTKQVTTRARQAGTTNEVSIRNLSGANTINNVFTGTGGFQFNYESAGGSLTINTWNTTGSGGARTLRLLGAADGQINNWTHAVGNAVTLIKDGAGTWTLGAGVSKDPADATFVAVTANGGALTLNSSTRVTGAVTANAGAINFNHASQTVAGAVTVNSGGSVTFNGNGANMSNSATVNSGGTLTVVSPDGTTGEIGNAATPTTLTVKAGATFDASSFSVYNLQIAQTIVAGGTLKAGQITAFGDNAFHIGDSAAPTSVGTLSVVGNLSLSNQFSTDSGGLFFNLGNSTTPGAGVNDLISIAGDLVIDNTGGPINVRLAALGSGLTTGTYRLIEFTSGTTKNASDFNLLGFSAGQSRQSAQILTAPNQVNLEISGAAANLVWVGDGSANVWDSATTANFLNTATNQPDKFFPFDNALFDDTSPNKTVNIAGTVTLGSATVNTTGTYTFTGPGIIDGGGTLTKNGPGTLIIANTGPNTWSGATTINAGTLQVGTGGADGTLGTGAITNNATLVFDKSTDVTLPAMSGTGAFIKRGAGNLILSAASTFAGPITIETGQANITNAAGLGDVAQGTTVLSGGALYSTANLTIDEPLTLAGDGTGAGALRTGGATATTFTAPITLSADTNFFVDGGAGFTVSNTLTGAGTNLALRGDGGGNGLISGNITLGTGGITKTGAATWTLTGLNSFSGPVTLTAGSLAFSAPEALGTGTINFNGGNLLWAAGNTADVSIRFAPIPTGVLAGLDTGANEVTLATPITGSGGINKLGAGRLILSATNTFTGNVLVSNGLLRAAAGTGLPATANLSLDGGALELASPTYTATLGTAAGQVQLPGGTSGFSAAPGTAITVTINNAGNPILWGSPEFNPGSLLLNNAAATDTLTLNADLDLNGAQRSFTVAGAPATLNGVISNSSATAAGIRVDGAGTLVLAQPSTFTGSSIIDSGPQEATKVRAAADNALGTGAVTLGEGGNATSARLELTGNITLPNALSINGRNNDSVAIQNLSGNNTLSGAISLNAGGDRYWVQSDAGSLALTGGISAGSGNRNLTLQGASGGSVTGVIANGAGAVLVTKRGTGTWTLSGANTYTGMTTVAGGTLILAPDAQTVVTAGAGATITSGRLVFDYAGNPGTPATLLGLLDTSADANFASGQFRTTTDAIHTLGYLDNPAASTFTVMYTYVGDLNLDGRVNGDDYALLDRGDAMNLTGWSNGDVNYDGTVNATDYLLTDTAFGQQTGVLSPALLAQRQSQFGQAYVSQLIAAVPEPTTLAACGLALPALLRRRRTTQ